MAENVEEMIDLALARASLCRILKLGLHNPDETALNLLFCDEGRAVVRDAARLVEPADASGLRPAAEVFCKVEPMSPARARDAYDGLFGHTARGRVCPYETEYGGDHLFLQSQELSDIIGYLTAFGLAPKTDLGERVDHIAVEWEYLEFLSEKEAFALCSDDAVMLERTRKAYRCFLRDHLSPFGRAFARGLMKEDSLGFYGALARLCEAFLVSECRRLGVPVGPQFLPLRPESLDDAPMACGSGSELVQID
jgi:TorA maturation chaperone TorD